MKIVIKSKKCFKMAVKLLDARILHIKPNAVYKNVWQQKSPEEVKTLLGDDVENLLGAEVSKAVASTLGVEIPEQVTRGHFEKNDIIIPVLFDQGKITFFQLTFKKVS